MKAEVPVKSEWEAIRGGIKVWGGNGSHLHCESIRFDEIYHRENSKRETKEVG